MCRNFWFYTMSAVHCPAYQSCRRFCTDTSCDRPIRCYPTMGDLPGNFKHQVKKIIIILPGRFYSSGFFSTSFGHPAKVENCRESPKVCKSESPKVRKSESP